MHTSFIEQIDRYSCGPIAVVNATRWASEGRFKNLTVSRCKRFLSTRPGVGTTEVYSISSLLNKTRICFASKLRYNPTQEQIETHLKQQGAFIFGLRVQDFLHIVFAYAKNGNIVLVNAQLTKNYPHLAEMSLSTFLETVHEQNKNKFHYWSIFISTHARPK